jgi:hypothetical protein
MLQLLTSIFKAIAEGLGFARDRTKLKNAEPMVKAKEAQEENKKVDAAAKAVAEQNVDEIRKQISE